MKNPDLEEIKEESPDIICNFCQKSEVNEVEWGPLYRLKDVTVHYFCMLFSSALVQTGQDHEGIQGFMLQDLRKEINRGRKLKCKYCKKNRATIGCMVQKCKISFHFPCGVANGTAHQFTKCFASYCPSHKPEIIIPDTVPKPWNCLICLGDVKKNENFVWSSFCCKVSIFHRLCLQKYAKESGYYFKCPSCRAQKPFIKAVQHQCVYVPEKDASWEQEPSAFSELYASYSKCDAEVCLCPRGREFDDQENERWTICRCNGCGAQGTHFRCSKLKKPDWSCSECTAILNKGKDNYGSRGTTSDGNYSSYCQLRLASRSSMVGIEQEVEILDSPRDYIRQPPAIIVVDSSSDDDDQVFQRMRKKKRQETTKDDEDEVQIVYPTPSNSSTLVNSFRKKLNDTRLTSCKMTTDNTQFQIQNQELKSYLSSLDNLDMSGAYNNTCPALPF